MDDPSGHHMDSDIYRNKFRLLSLLVGAEGGARGVTGTAELFGHRLRPWEDVWLVIGSGVDVPAALGGDVYGSAHGVHWLWSPVACHAESHCLAIFCGQLFIILPSMWYLFNYNYYYL